VRFAAVVRHVVNDARRWCWTVSAYVSFVPSGSAQIRPRLEACSNVIPTAP
jgi:hypothetical protein